MHNHTLALCILLILLLVFSPCFVLLWIMKYSFFSPNPLTPSHTALNGWTAPQRLVTRQKCDKCTLQALVKRPRTHDSQPAIEPTFNWSSTFYTLHLMLLWKGFFLLFFSVSPLIFPVIRAPSTNGGVCSQTQIHCWPLPTWPEQK